MATAIGVTKDGLIAIRDTVSGGTAYLNPDDAEDVAVECENVAKNGADGDGIIIKCEYGQTISYSGDRVDFTQMAADLRAARDGAVNRGAHVKH